MYNIIVDTGYWIALLEPEQNPMLTEKAAKIVEDIEIFNLIIPYPTLYEFVNTRLSRREGKTKLKHILELPNVFKCDDIPYKQRALENFFEKAIQTSNDVSLVDEVILLMLSDKGLKIDYILSFDYRLINQAASIGVKNAING